ncbi:MAG: Tyrosine-specific transport protein [Chlamydiae bacterium]|nr:Tyrosine-specific transport protein [Chlamydiota bacterium]
MKNPKVEKGSLLGGILLIAGSAIGGGMLGLPIVTGIAGFYPAVVIFCFCWAFMTTTALLLLEVNLSFKAGINLLGMTKQTLGKVGKNVCWITYLFLFFCMLVAYIDASGSLTQQFINKSFAFQIKGWQGSLFFTVLFGVFVYIGTALVDHVNRLFMLGLILTYLFVIGFGTSEVQPSFFSHKAWSYSLLAIPVTITSFGYHNIIPTLTSYLKKDRRRMIQMVVVGGGIPLLVYILWDWLILGVVPAGSFHNKLTLENILGFIKYPLMGQFVQYFAFFAIVTSFLAQALALLDFLRDALKVADNWFNRIWLIMLVLGLPYIVAMVYPGMFIQALGLVGGFAAIILFVFIPAFMVWELRYKRKKLEHKIVPGGRIMLSIVILIGFFVMAVQLIQEIFSIEMLKNIL